MTRKFVKNEIIEQYIRSGRIIYKATMLGDYKKNNIEGKKLVNILQYLKENMPLAKDVLPDLFDNENVVVRTKAAAHCLALGININMAEKLLKKDAANDKNGIFAFNAEMTLKVWREQGHLKF